MNKSDIQTCGKPLERTAIERAAVRAVIAAVNATLGEVVRQGGAVGNIEREARADGIATGMTLLPRCERAHGHADLCDDHAHRGVDYDCEDCGQREGFFLDNGWRRCKKCGYPSK